MLCEVRERGLQDSVEFKVGNEVVDFMTKINSTAKQSSFGGEEHNLENFGFKMSRGIQDIMSLQTSCPDQATG